MEQPASVRLGELSRRLALLQDETAQIDPQDENAVETLQAKFSDWRYELYKTLEPYPERWAEVKQPVRAPHRFRRTPLLFLQAAIAADRRRLADLMHGWSD